MIILFLLLACRLCALSLSLSQGQVASFSIAIVPFLNEEKTKTPIASVIQNNLSTSIYFTHLTKEQYANDIIFPQMPIFNLWKAQKTHFVVTGKISFEQSRIRVQYHVWDILSTKLLLEGAIILEQSAWRRAGHIISDQIHKKIVGISSCFDTQIAFIHETPGKKKLAKQLAIMDQDGENIRILTPISSKVLTPCFSPTANLLTFTSFTKTIPKVYFVNLETGQVQFIRSFPGMTYAPHFSPDGKSLIFSGAVGAESNIYIYDLISEKIKRLTKNSLTETSPNFSPDGEKIVFTAGSTGQPHLFIMDKNGTNRHKLTHQKGGYSAPAWSPSGEYIAFTKHFGGDFYIGIIRPDGTGERLLTKGYLVESPQWAPDGQRIVFCRQERAKKDYPNPSKICTIDITGHNERTIRSIKHGSDPAWSQVLPTTSS